MFIELPRNATHEQLATAYAAGLVPKEQLVHGAYYRGDCRNAQTARWHAGMELFVHWQREMGQRILVRIKHPADEARYDVFLARERVEPGADNIADDQFEAAARF